jgi:hypothetical protein
MMIFTVLGGKTAKWSEDFMKEELKNLRERGKNCKKYGTLTKNKDQVDRYKNLLQKQSDIMIALTTRLNERDETILQLQEELDACDQLNRENETFKGMLAKRVKLLEEHLKKNRISVPAIEPDEEMSLQDHPDKVKIGDCETFNVTYSNLLSPNEKIKELAQLADSRKNQIDQLENQIRSLEADSRQIAIEASRADSRPTEEIEVIASSVNDIIQKLSQQNSADVLKHVAKKLLDLQKFTSDILSTR